MSSTFGKAFRLTTWGESHGPEIGGVIDGCPANLKIDVDAIQHQLSRRRPGQSKLTTPRDEKDQVIFVSGLQDNVTTGTPLAFRILNTNAKPSDYSNAASIYRPSHADFTYEKKYGIRSSSGGGRASARETAVRVAAGSIAEQLLARHGVQIVAWVEKVHTIRAVAAEFPTRNAVDANAVRCPSVEVAEEMSRAILEAKKIGDSLGGVIAAAVTGAPAGWGEPVFDKLEADLAKAMMSLPAVKGFEVGSGFSSTDLKGSEHNDPFAVKDGATVTTSNFSGGIQGGISNGMPITMRVAFKPTATIMQKQSSVDEQGNEVTLQPKGRHDPCVVPRAVPIVEAMTALVLADHYLRQLRHRNRPAGETP